MDEKAKAQKERKVFLILVVLAVLWFVITKYPVISACFGVVILASIVLIYAKNSRFRTFVRSKLHLKTPKSEAKDGMNTAAVRLEKPELKYMCPKPGCGGYLEETPDWKGHGWCDTCKSVQRIK